MKANLKIERTEAKAKKYVAGVALLAYTLLFSFNIENVNGTVSSIGSVLFNKLIK